MTLDAETKAFLDLDDVEVAPWTAARAAERDLVLPPPVLPTVIDNVALLKSQAALIVAALGSHASDTSEMFQP
jgi:hypothetical protein